MEASEWTGESSGDEEEVLQPMVESPSGGGQVGTGGDSWGRCHESHAKGGLTT